MTTKQSVIMTRYREEASETSSIADEEINRILTSEVNREFTDMPAGMTSDFTTLKYIKNLPQPSTEVIERTKRDPSYPMYTEEFQRRYGKDAYDPMEVERVNKKLDSNFKILQEHTKEVERKDCDLMLYKNKIQKDLGDVMNDLKEAYNIITILIADRSKLQDLFAVYSVDIKVLEGQKKNLEEDLKDRDKTIERLKAQLEGLQRDVEKYREQYRLAKKTADERNAEIGTLRRDLTEQRVEFTRMSKANELQRGEIQDLKKELGKMRESLRKKTEEVERLQGEIPALKEANNRFAIKNDDLTRDLAKYQSLYDELKTRAEPLEAQVKQLTTDNEDLKLANDQLIATVRKLEEEVKDLKDLTKDLKPRNDELTTQLEDLTNQLSDAVNDASALRKKPEELNAEFAKKMAELNSTIEGLRETNSRLSLENEQHKRDMNDIIEEKKKRNNERRKKKEEQLKKIADDAREKMELNKKKLEDKRSALDADNLLKNVRNAQETLEKYPETTEDATDHVNDYLDDDMPHYEIPKLPVDINSIDSDILVSEQKGRGKDSVLLKSSYYNFKDIGGRRPAAAAAGAGGLISEYGGSGAGGAYRTGYHTSVVTSGAGGMGASDINCPYCWTGERDASCPVHAGSVGAATAVLASGGGLSGTGVHSGVYSSAMGAPGAGGRSATRTVVRTEYNTTDRGGDMREVRESKQSREYGYK